MLHRIIGVAGDRYTFKGDNNHFVDSYQPVQEPADRADVGAHSLGRALPALAAGAAASFSSCRRRSPGARRRTADGSLRGGSENEKILETEPVSPKPFANPSARSFGTFYLTAGILLLCFAGLAALSYTRPLTRQAVRQGLYSQSGAFSYHADVPGGSTVYGATAASTGQPLFLALVHSARFRGEP